MKSMIVGPIVHWFVDAFMRNLELFIETIALEVREVRQSGKLQEYLDMIENPLVKVAASALLDGIEAYLDSLNIEEVVNLG